MGWTEEKMREMKKDPAMKKKMMRSYVIQFVASLVMAYVLAHIVDFAKGTTVMAGLQAGFWTWLGFIATTFLGAVLWENRSWKLYAINSGHYLVNLMLMGVILALWQ